MSTTNRVFQGHAASDTHFASKGPIGLPQTWRDMIARHSGLLRGYSWALGGSVGRLVISLAYFIAIANALSIADFGLFATASATGVVLSRVAALGFYSPLYRIATVKPRLIGTYALGYVAALGLSLPLVALGGAIAFALVFAGEMTVRVFCLIVVAEALLWRSTEIIIIVCNGMGRFARAALLLVIGSSLRAAFAVGFAVTGQSSLSLWAWAYLAANAIALAIGLSAFFPRSTLRWRPQLYLRRWQDSLSVAGAEILFYLQSELGKLLVLAIGGPLTAGIYAIIMRLVDLTALPIRSFNMMLVQMTMRSRQVVSAPRTRMLIEAGVAAVSTAGLLFFAGVLALYPTVLGSNVAEAAPLLILVLVVPAARNLIEYQAELLYATGRTFRRAVNLAIIGLCQAAMLASLLAAFPTIDAWVPLLNPVFVALYVLSVFLTYPALRGAAPQPI